MNTGARPDQVGAYVTFAAPTILLVLLGIHIVQWARGKSTFSFGRLPRWMSENRCPIPALISLLGYYLIADKVVVLGGGLGSTSRPADAETQAEDINDLISAAIMALSFLKIAQICEWSEVDGAATSAIAFGLLDVAAKSIAIPAIHAVDGYGKGVLS
jgi:hypothetical protein